MAVLIGSARINELGTIGGGKPGDNTGKEVSTQNWYLHEKGWIVLRAKDADVREKIAKCMEMACANDHIGYSQPKNLTLYNACKGFRFDVSKVETDVECDCSSLVRVCCLYAGIPDMGAFSTAIEPKVLMNTGKFDQFTDSAYCNGTDYLMRGDILVTKSSGHTVVVLTNGSKAGTTASADPTPKSGQHTVVRGDTLSAIAREFGVSVDSIVSANKNKYPTISRNYIVVGWTLDVGEVKEQSMHTVVRGDTLSKIANKYGTSVQAIVDKNKNKYPAITPNHIVVGWILIV